MLKATGIKYYQVISSHIMRIRRVKKVYLNATEAAATLGISKQTLLRYEGKGIFPKANRNQVNGWREYTEQDIQKLRKIIGR
ncbi:MAG: MerR family transcriptional regulator [Candidatus Omnitrophica bacterium]|nr:MerR family transcriptional regulator [Candidatus Omnitrophota bacterium]